MNQDNSTNTEETLGSLGQELRNEYDRKRRLLSFSEYFDLVARDPVRHARNSAQYVKDAFDHFGDYDVHRPGGQTRRFRLFDCEFDGGRNRLVGQEQVQNDVYRILDGFVRQGKVNRLVLLHGPNGSAKSTFVEVLSRALKHYSTLEDGACYRFNWVFPLAKSEHGGIGFSPGTEPLAAETDSYAHYPDEAVEARLTDELRDHPLLLIPAGRRRELLEELLEQAGASDFKISDYLLHGDLSHRNRQIFETLLAAHQGDYQEVLRYVQVERYFLSRRYRTGLVTVEPKMAVDARTRQLTMDRNLATLPPVLQNIELLGYSGELVDANRGVIEFSDLLKRPVEAFKYLIHMVETGRVNLEGALLYTDSVFFGSTNELHLAAFREVADFSSFRGRLELVRVPYLLDHRVEAEIYSDQLAGETGGRHVAPHTVEVAAMWAVMTRLHPPNPESYDKEAREVVQELTPLEKARLYSEGLLPSRFGGEKLKALQRSVERMVHEYDAKDIYEGFSGASPRVLLQVLFGAAQRTDEPFLSPLTVTDEVAKLCEKKSLFDFLRREAHPKGFFDAREALEQVFTYLVGAVEKEMWDAVGLVEEEQVGKLLEKYVDHVSSWVKGEKIRNPMTGEHEEPDVTLMEDVEGRLGIEEEDRDAYRNEVITRIAAWALAHRGESPDLPGIFARELRQLKDQVFEERRGTLRSILEDVVLLVDEGEDGVDVDRLPAAKSALGELIDRMSYSERSAREIVGFFLRQTAERGGAKEEGEEAEEPAEEPEGEGEAEEDESSDDEQ
jgi:predicted Ser/Thr protein kinase